MVNDVCHRQGRGPSDGDPRHGSGVRLAKCPIIAGQHLARSIGSALPWPEAESVQGILSLPALGVCLSVSAKDIDRSICVSLVQLDVIMSGNHYESLRVVAFNYTPAV